MICPFIAQFKDGLAGCVPSCALYISGKCAFRILAEKASDVVNQTERNHQFNQPHQPVKDLNPQS